MKANTRFVTRKIYESTVQAGYVVDTPTKESRIIETKGYPPIWVSKISYPKGESDEV